MINVSLIMLTDGVAPLHSYYVDMFVSNIHTLPYVLDGTLGTKLFGNIAASPSLCQL